MSRYALPLPGESASPTYGTYFCWKDEEEKAMSIDPHLVRAG